MGGNLEGVRAASLPISARSRRALDMAESALLGGAAAIAGAAAAGPACRGGLPWPRQGAGPHGDGGTWSRRPTPESAMREERALRAPADAAQPRRIWPNGWWQRAKAIRIVTTLDAKPARRRRTLGGAGARLISTTAPISPWSWSITRPAMCSAYVGGTQLLGPVRPGRSGGARPARPARR